METRQRTRWDVGQPGAQPVATVPITLEQLTAQLAATMAPVTGGMRELQDCITSMESEVTAKMGPTLELIKTADRRQKAMSEQLGEMQLKVEEQAQKYRDQDATIQEVLRRLEVLERDGAAGQPAVWRRPLAASGEDAKS